MSLPLVDFLIPTTAACLECQVEFPTLLAIQNGVGYLKRELCRDCEDFLSEQIAQEYRDHERGL